MKKYLITVNSKQYEVEVEEVKGASKVAQTLNSAPKLKTAVTTNHIKEPKAVAGGKKVSAPMPGNVMKIHVNQGDIVTKGQLLLVFEAMKMENELTSPADGTIAQVNTSEGTVMAAGDVLVVIE